MAGARAPTRILTVFSKAECSLCDDAMEAIAAVLEARRGRLAAGAAGGAGAGAAGGAALGDGHGGAARRETWHDGQESGARVAAWATVASLSTPGAEDGTGVEVVKVDITAPENGRWLQAYQYDIPVVHLDGRRIMKHRVDPARLAELLDGAPAAATARPS